MTRVIRLGPCVGDGDGRCACHDDCRCTPMRDGLCVCCRKGLEAELEFGDEEDADNARQKLLEADERMAARRPN